MINQYTKVSFYESLKGYTKLNLLWGDTNVYLRIRRNKNNLVKHEIIVKKDNDYFKFVEYRKSTGFSIVNDIIDEFMMTAINCKNYKNIMGPKRFKHVINELRMYLQDFDVIDTLQAI